MLKVGSHRMELESARPIVCFGDSDVLQLMFEQAGGAHRNQIQHSIS